MLTLKASFYLLLHMHIVSFVCYAAWSTLVSKQLKRPKATLMS